MTFDPLWLPTSPIPVFAELAPADEAIDHTAALVTQWADDLNRAGHTLQASYLTAAALLLHEAAGLYLADTNPTEQEPSP